MGDITYQFPVALTWDPKFVEKKVLLYFQKNRESGGGDCEIRDTNSDQGHCLIYFKDKKARDGVLKNKDHKVKLELPVSVTEVATPLSQGDPVDNGAAGRSEDRAQPQGQEAMDRSWGGASAEFPAGSGANERLGGGVSGVQDSRGPPSIEPRPQEEYGAAAAERSSYILSRPAASNWAQLEPGTGAGNPRGPERNPKTSGAAAASGASEQIFGPVVATLLTKYIPASLQQEVVEKFPSFTTVKSDDGTEVKGTFHEIEAVYHYLRERIVDQMETSADTEVQKTVPETEVQKTVPETEVRKTVPETEVRKTVPETEVRKTVPETEVRKTVPETEVRKTVPETEVRKTVPEREEEMLSVPAASCEYVMEIYRSEMEEIERRHHVAIVLHSTSGGSTYIKVVPQGPQSSTQGAKEAITDKVQEAMGDWSQEMLDPSIAQLPSDDLKHRVRSRWSKVLVIQQDGRIILRGPREQISQAKMFLEKRDPERSFSEPRESKTYFSEKSFTRDAEYNPSPIRRPVTISNNDMMSGIPVDARHLDILRKLRSREISDIEKKYRVMMEDRITDRKDGSVLVTFRAANGLPDLSPHAAHCFSTLLQKTFFNITRRVISLSPGYPPEHIDFLQKELRAAELDVILESHGAFLILIGHPLHVALAEEMLSGVQQPSGAQAAATSTPEPGEPMDTTPPSGDKKKEEEDDKCSICLSDFTDKQILPKCKHAFCSGCVQQAMAHKPVCPICAVPYGEIRGDQPDGTMRDKTTAYHLPGYPGCRTIEITYNIPSGIQQAHHPHPGVRFSGVIRTAYLPDNAEGREILRLLRTAFDRRLIFTVGDSRTTGATDVVTWNDIHHKTSVQGGPQSFGYPDPHYLRRVREELKAKGIE